MKAILEVGERFELRAGGITYWGYVEAVYGASTQTTPVTAFSMRDPRWRMIPLLHSNKYTIGSAGCAIVSAAMVISQVDPDVTPATLNERLRASHLSDNGLLGWESIPLLWPEIVYDGPEVRYTDGDLVWVNKPADMDRVWAELAKSPIVIAVDYRPGGAYQNHFVLGMEARDEDIIIIDPLDGETVSLKERYGKSGWDLARAIYGLRLLRVKE